MVALGFQQNDFSFFRLDDKIRIVVDEPVDAEISPFLVAGPEFYVIQVCEFIYDFRFKIVETFFRFVQPFSDALAPHRIWLLLFERIGGLQDNLVRI